MRAAAFGPIPISLIISRRRWRVQQPSAEANASAVILPFVIEMISAAAMPIVARGAEPRCVNTSISSWMKRSTTSHDVRSIVASQARPQRAVPFVVNATLDPQYIPGGRPEQPGGHTRLQARTDIVGSWRDLNFPVLQLRSPDQNEGFAARPADDLRADVRRYAIRQSTSARSRPRTSKSNSTRFRIAAGGGYLLKATELRDEWLAALRIG